MRTLIILFGAFGCMAMLSRLQFLRAQSSLQVHLNQLGFYTTGPKVAIVTGESDVRMFFIISANGDTVFNGELGETKRSAYSSMKTRIADFSSFSRKGNFYIFIPGGYTSPKFTIGDDILRDVAIASLKGYYFQRSAMELKQEFAGKWHRPSGHTDTNVLIHPSAASANRPAGTIVSSAHGWYDAGDYNKYIVNSGITMGTLLSAWEDFPAYYDKLNVNIPESGNEIPDILDEVLYNLRWMLTMQDPDDGGVYHKCTNAEFDGMVMPGETRVPRYVVKKSTTATLDFVAVTAQAARVFRQFNKQLPGLADSCLTASKLGWNWAKRNPAVLYQQDEMNKIYQPPIKTGAYGDRKLSDEWLWAASELFVTTKEPEYLNILNEKLREPVSLPSWNNVAMLGYYSMVRKEKHLPAKAQLLVSAMKDSIVSRAEMFLQNAKGNAFATVMGQTKNDFNWGGNSVACNQGILLLQAYMLKNDERYLNGAISNIDYILGRNATGYSFITGIGTKTPMHPHHRQSEADGIPEPVPGLLVGGPNIGMQDSCNYPHKEVETAYVDNVCSYASNEIAINWNAPAVYLINGVRAIRSRR